MEAVLEKEYNQVHEVLCLGDTVNYGPWANECVDLLVSVKAKVVKGNHEGYFLAGLCNEPNVLVQQFFKTCFPMFNRFTEIQGLQESLQIGEWTAKHILYSADTGKLIVGHTHYQEKRSTPTLDVINPGSVGQNRKDLGYSSYCVWDTDGDSFQFKNLRVNPKNLIHEMSRLAYPQLCIDYYQGKIKS